MNKSHKTLNFRNLRGSAAVVVMTFRPKKAKYFVVVVVVCVRTYTRLSQSAFVRFLFNLVLCVDA